MVPCRSGEPVIGAQEDDAGDIIPRRLRDYRAAVKGARELMASISYEKFTLSNGLDVILHEDHSVPIAAVNVWYHVGSKDEEAGKTGFAHLFEHVMFEGSKNHNRSYFDPLQKVGAALNGSTSPDRTNYWENVPSNYLELALWLEADRMGFLLDALDQERFDVQRDVVKNERRQSYENRPYGMVPMLLQPAVFPPPHPYSWMTIGAPEDLDAASLDDVKSFFRRFYAPSNASLAIAGDIVMAEARRLVERYFGDLEPEPTVSRVGRMDSQLTGRVSLSMSDRVQLSRLYLVWPTVPDFDADQAPLDIVATVLGDGKSSRLYRSLVHEKRVARDVAVAHHAQQIAGEFYIQVTVNASHTVEEVEGLVWEEMERVRREPIGEVELERAKNRVETFHVRQFQRVGGFGGRADLLNYYNTHAGDPAVINTDIDRYLSVSVDEVQRAVSKSLGDQYVRLTVLPEESLTPGAGSVDRSVMPKGASPPAFSPPIPRRMALSNGLRIVFLPKDGLPMVSFGLLLGAGSTTDPADTPGLADLTASMLTEGTSTRSSQQIADEMEFLGAGLGCDVAREFAVLSTETLTSNWEKALAIMADVALNPTFPPEDLKRVRDERLTDLRRIGDNPAAIAARASHALLYGPDSPYGHPISGTERAVEAISGRALKGHFRGYYGPEAATLIVVGDVAEDEVLSKAEAYLGDWASDGVSPGLKVEGTPSPADGTTIFLADKPGAAQSVIRTGLLTIPRHHADYFAMNLLNYTFGGQFAGRLNMNLRQQKGYSYGYMSGIDWVNGPSALQAGGAVQTSVTREAVAETLKEFAEIRDSRPVTPEEFEAARDGMLRALPAQFETQGQILQQLVRLVVFGLPDDYFAGVADKVKAVELADVHRVARERIDDGHLKILVVGDGAVVEPGLGELGPPIVPIDYDGRPLE